MALGIVSFGMLLIEFSWIVLAVALCYFFIVGDAMFGITYKISDNKLQVRSGIFSKDNYDIRDLVEIAPSTSWESAPAASLDRIKLVFKGSAYVIVSPQRKSDFINHLRSVKPDVKVSVKL